MTRPAVALPSAPRPPLDRPAPGRVALGVCGGCNASTFVNHQARCLICFDRAFGVASVGDGIIAARRWPSAGLPQ